MYIEHMLNKNKSQLHTRNRANPFTLNKNLKLWIEGIRTLFH